MSERRVRRRKPRLKFDKQMYKKLGILFWIVVLALFALCTRIAYLNVAKGDNYSIKVLEQQSFTSKTIPYKRGDIKDRNGNVLATSVMVYNLIIDSKVVMSNEKYLTPTVNALVKYFDFNEDDLRTAIKERKNNSYWVAKKNLEYKDIQKFESYLNYEYADTKEEETTVQNTKGIWFEKKYKRMYPYNSLACSLLGFANSDNSATIGIESSYNSFLQGTDGREYGYMDSDNNMETVIKDAKDGDNIVSSIDMNIQRIVQKSIKKYMKKYSPKRISVVIANPNNGEILAMADDTTFDLNDPYNLEDYYTEAQISSMSQKKQSEKLNSIWNNYCITDSYEPGSTAKPFTVAAAFEEGKINRKSTFTCDGQESTAVEAGVDAIVSGAGLPLELPGLVEKADVALAPIVSSGRAAKLILRRWAKAFNRTADFVVIEGCKAGGHLGFSEEELLAGKCQTLDEILPEVLAEVKPFEAQFGHDIPVFVAGGVYTGEDIAHYTKMGAAGAQLATRFIPTYECDASQTYKDVLLAAKPEDVRIIHSPVGMPGRALATPLVQKLEQGLRFPPKHCARCLKACEPAKVPYCITHALIEAVKGNVEEGLFFCGANVGRLDRMRSVRELMDELMDDWRKHQ